MASVGNSFDVFDEFLRRKQESQEEAAEIEEVGSASSSSYYEEEIVEEDINNLEKDVNNVEEDDVTNHIEEDLTNLRLDTVHEASDVSTTSNDDFSESGEFCGEESEFWEEVSESLHFEKEDTHNDDTSEELKAKSDMLANVRNMLGIQKSNQDDSSCVDGSSQYSSASDEGSGGSSSVLPLDYDMGSYGSGELHASDEEDEKPDDYEEACRVMIATVHPQLDPNTMLHGCDLESLYTNLKQQYQHILRNPAQAPCTDNERVLVTTDSHDINKLTEIPLQQGSDNVEDAIVSKQVVDDATLNNADKISAIEQLNSITGVASEQVTNDSDSAPIIEKWLERDADDPEDYESACHLLCQFMYDANNPDYHVDTMLRRSTPRDLYRYLKHHYWYLVHTDQLNEISYYEKNLNYNNDEWGGDEHQQNGDGSAVEDTALLNSDPADETNRRPSNKVAYLTQLFSNRIESSEERKVEDLEVCQETANEKSEIQCDDILTQDDQPSEEKNENNSDDDKLSCDDETKIKRSLDDANEFEQKSVVEIGDEYVEIREQIHANEIVPDHEDDRLNESEVNSVSENDSTHFEVEINNVEANSVSEIDFMNESEKKHVLQTSPVSGVEDNCFNDSETNSVIENDSFDENELNHALEMEEDGLDESESNFANEDDFSDENEQENAITVGKDCLDKSEENVVVGDGPVYEIKHGEVLKNGRILGIENDCLDESEANSVSEDGSSDKSEHDVETDPFVEVENEETSVVENDSQDDSDKEIALGVKDNRFDESEGDPIVENHTSDKNEQESEQSPGADHSLEVEENCSEEDQSNSLIENDSLNENESKHALGVDHSSDESEHDVETDPFVEVENEETSVVENDSQDDSDKEIALGVKDNRFDESEGHPIVENHTSDKNEQESEQSPGADHSLEVEENCSEEDQSNSLIENDSLNENESNHAPGIENHSSDESEHDAAIEDASSDQSENDVETDEVENEENSVVNNDSQDDGDKEIALGVKDNRFDESEGDTIVENDSSHESELKHDYDTDPIIEVKPLADCKQNSNISILEEEFFNDTEDYSHVNHEEIERIELQKAYLLEHMPRIIVDDPREIEFRKKRIQGDLRSIIEEAEEIVMNESFSSDIVAALNVGCLKTVFTKRFYHPMQRNYMHYPSVAKAIYNFSLLEEAEKVFHNELSFELSTALCTAAASRLKSDINEVDENDIAVIEATVSLVYDSDTKGAESEIREKRIQNDLLFLIKDAEENHIGDDIEEEAINALLNAANEIVFTKKYYDKTTDIFKYFPSAKTTILNYSLTEKAEEFYFDGAHDFPLDYTSALRAAAGRLHEDFEVDELDDTVINTATDVEIEDVHDEKQPIMVDNTIEEGSRQHEISETAIAKIDHNGSNTIVDEKNMEFNKVSEKVTQDSMSDEKVHSLLESYLDRKRKINQALDDLESEFASELNIIEDKANACGLKYKLEAERIEEDRNRVEEQLLADKNTMKEQTKALLEKLSSAVKALELERKNNATSSETVDTEKDGGKNWGWFNNRSKRNILEKEKHKQEQLMEFKLRESELEKGVNDIKAQLDFVKQQTKAKKRNISEWQAELDEEYRHLEDFTSAMEEKLNQEMIRLQISHDEKKQRLLEELDELEATRAENVAWVASEKEKVHDKDYLQPVSKLCLENSNKGKEEGESNVTTLQLVKSREEEAVLLEQESLERTTDGSNSIDLSSNNRENQIDNEQRSQLIQEAKENTISHHPDEPSSLDGETSKTESESLQSGVRNQIPKKPNKSKTMYQKDMQNLRSESEQKRIDGMHHIFQQAGLLDAAKYRPEADEKISCDDKVLSTKSSTVETTIDGMTKSTSAKVSSGEDDCINSDTTGTVEENSKEDKCIKRDVSSSSLKCNESGDDMVPNHLASLNQPRELQDDTSLCSLDVFDSPEVVDCSSKRLLAAALKGKQAEDAETKKTQEESQKTPSHLASLNQPRELQDDTSLCSLDVFDSPEVVDCSSKRLLAAALKGKQAEDAETKKTQEESQKTPSHLASLNQPRELQDDTSLCSLDVFDSPEVVDCSSKRLLAAALKGKQAEDAESKTTQGEIQKTSDSFVPPSSPKQHQDASSPISPRALDFSKGSEFSNKKFLDASFTGKQGGITNPQPAEVERRTLRVSEESAGYIAPTSTRKLSEMRRKVDEALERAVAIRNGDLSSHSNPSISHESQAVTPLQNGSSGGSDSPRQNKSSELIPLENSNRKDDSPIKVTDGTVSVLSPSPSKKPLNTISMIRETDRLSGFIRRYEKKLETVCKSLLTLASVTGDEKEVLAARQLDLPEMLDFVVNQDWYKTHSTATKSEGVPHLIFSKAKNENEGTATTNNQNRRASCPQLTSQSPSGITAGYKLTVTGKQFLQIDGPESSDICRFLTYLDRIEEGLHRDAMLEQWKEIARLSGDKQSQRICDKLDQLISFCLDSHLIKK